MIQGTTSLHTLEIFDRFNVKEDNDDIHSDECEMEIIISEVHENAIDKYFGLNEESKDPMLKDGDTYNFFKENFESMNMQEIHINNPECSFQFNHKPLNINQEPFEVYDQVLQDFHNSINGEADCSRLVENEQEDAHYEDMEIIDEFAKINEMEIVISEVRGNAIDMYFDESKNLMLNDANTYNVFKENFQSMNVDELHLTNPENQFNLKAMDINQEPFDIHNEALPDFHTSPNEDCSRHVENEEEDTHYDNIDIIDEFAKITEESFYPNESEK